MPSKPKKQPQARNDRSPVPLKIIPISELIPDKDNPRKDLQPTDPEYQKIKTSIGEFQFLDPIIFNTRTKVIIGGHQRLKILQDNGINQLYVFQLGGYSWAFSETDLKELSPVKEKAANIALNRAAGDWDFRQLSITLTELKEQDFDINLTGFTDKELKDIDTELFGKEAKEDDYEPPPEIVTDIKRGDIYQLGRHRVMCGDSTNAADVKALVGGGKINLVLTDPPYAVNYENQEREPGRKTRKEKGDSYVDPVDALKLLEGFIGILPSDILVMTFPINKHFHDLSKATAGWDLLYDCVWIKNHFAYIMGRRYQPKHEPILIFRRANARNAGIWNVPANQSTVFEFDKPSKNPDHPTPKPIELWGKLVEYHSNAGTEIYDPFLGSGTTLIACEQLGRIAYGMEISPAYVSVILRRFHKLKPDVEIKCLNRDFDIMGEVST